MNRSGVNGEPAYDIANVIGNLEFTIGTSTLGVYDTFRDAFSVEVGEEVD
jgi:hypothetical protein